MLFVASKGADVEIIGGGGGGGRLDVAWVVGLWRGLRANWRDFNL